MTKVICPNCGTTLCELNGNQPFYLEIKCGTCGTGVKEGKSEFIAFEFPKADPIRTQFAFMTDKFPKQIQQIYDTMRLWSIYFGGNATQTLLQKIFNDVELERKPNSHFSVQDFMPELFPEMKEE